LTFFVISSLPVVTENLEIILIGFIFFFTQIFVPRIQRTMGSSSTKQIAQDTTSVQTESHSITNANQDSFSVKELVLALAQDPLNVVSCRD